MTVNSVEERILAAARSANSSSSFMYCPACVALDLISCLHFTRESAPLSEPRFKSDELISKFRLPAYSVWLELIPDATKRCLLIFFRIAQQRHKKIFCGKSKSSILSLRIRIQSLLKMLDPDPYTFPHSKRFRNPSFCFLFLNLKKSSFFQVQVEHGREGYPGRHVQPEVYR